jgi:hypothetical protein
MWNGRGSFPIEGVRCPKAKSGVHRMLPGVSPKAVIKSDIGLNRKRPLKDGEFIWRNTLRA